MIDIFTGEFSRLLMWILNWVIIRPLFTGVPTPDLLLLLEFVMSSTGYSEDDLKRLSWQCRRGIKEVEVLLAPFFERHFRDLSGDEQDQFVALLAESDVDLFEWFTTRTKPEDPALRHIVNVILARVAS